ncbi:hypothetical protein AAG906_010931 [Vitis piasezkii]
MATKATPKMNLKLLINTEDNKVVFAEAEKDFIDFLFNLLTLPIGTIVGFLPKEGMVGCLGNLYDSIENLSQTYIMPNQDKDSLLKPNAPALSQGPLLLTSDAQVPTSSKKFYICSGCHRSMADDNSATCLSCRRCTSTEVNYIAPPAANQSSSDEGGFVRGVVTYMVMDDLVVKPMSTISSITLLNKFNVKEVGALEGLKLLKASLQSKAVLTGVFLGNIGA